MTSPRTTSGSSTSPNSNRLRPVPALVTVSASYLQTSTWAGLLLMASAACTPALFAADRALIMTISDYQRAPVLPGVKFDAVNAQKILSGLGFSSDHLRTLEETHLTLAGMRQALGQLAQEIGDGDRVFVYYSGHGMSYPIGNRCEQALVSQDMRPLTA